ncbi:hypothetical protein G3601_002704 [Salmonella enterica]|uniref:Uncharacterized protein n=2 Tax=Salmonella enterica TaxID=28901 RepID=A0A619HR16_SALER|nr:hypothetical protein [Salmonella enterica subsp. enterica serovar Newport]EAO1476576.1 hypothetical protein [Salmonella enterica]EBU8669758.1 hypothetical protein [Salmonella enterica subsp. enterica serovar Panama]EBY8640501.1 hypothetical protein [Salmonella enterica subsp. enterica serovar Java]ECF2802573.1 hypothetical protein [Salmonella enterica subsp. enterica serovar Miami]ECJ2405079.1 hypothetical protein [Salmonella enterica subsp. diarizonae]ECQ8979785.1 hypothetical protein [Sa
MTFSPSAVKEISHPTVAPEEAMQCIRQVSILDIISSADIGFPYRLKNQSFFFSFEKEFKAALFAAFFSYGLSLP